MRTLDDGLLELIAEPSPTRAERVWRIALVLWSFEAFARTLGDEPWLSGDPWFLGYTIALGVTYLFPRYAP